VKDGGISIREAEGVYSVPFNSSEGDWEGLWTWTANDQGWNLHWEWNQKKNCTKQP
jgi:hypothetical protein